jgi:hypothetical protein
VVMGKNLASFDTSDFPFSYINVDNERSILTPGMNIFTVGTRRDSEKWPLRDKRKDPVKHDLINFEFLSPYIIQKVFTAMDVLQELYDKASKKQETVFYKGIRIKRLMLKSTRKFYDMAVNIFLGDQVIRKLEMIDGALTMESIKKEFAPDSAAISEKWLDLSGMIAPEQTIQQLLADITSGTLNSLEKILSALEQIHTSYADEAWNWTTRILADRFDMDVKQISSDQLLDLVNRWESETIKLDKMILNDAAKEFDNSSKIGFGLDGDEGIRDMDFEAVRGVLDDNKFIKGIHKEIEQTELKASKLKEIIQSLQD